MILNLRAALMAVTAFIFLLSCSDLDQENNSKIKTDNAKQGVSHFPKREILLNCADAPDAAILDKDLSNALRNLGQIQCRKGLGHFLTAEKGQIWIYREEDYGGFRVPISASINAQVGAIIEGESFHDHFFSSVSLHQLEDQEKKVLFDKIRLSNPEKPLASRKFVFKISATNQNGDSQSVYLLSDLDLISDHEVDDNQEESGNYTIGFLCNPECEYNNLFYKRFWLNTGQLTKEIRAKYTKEP
jgi:hypothetical protein